jgi:hypothetical protein
MAIEQAIDEVQVAGTAASGTDRQRVRQMRFRTGRKAEMPLRPALKAMGVKT